MSFSLFASDFRGFSPRPGPVLPVSGHRGSALPAAAALAFPRSPGAGPLSRPPVRPRARLPGFPGFRSGRLFQPLSRSNRPLEPSGAGKWLSGVPGAAQGHPERRFCPCRRRGLFLGLPAAAGFPRSAPLLAPRGPQGRFQLPGGSHKGCWGLEGPHGGVLGPHRGIRSGGSPRRAGSPPGSSAAFPRSTPFGPRRPAGPFSAPGRCWKRWKRSCGLKARTGASWGRPGPSPGRLRAVLFSPAARASLLSPFPPSLFLTPCM